MDTLDLSMMKKMTSELKTKGKNTGSTRNLHDLAVREKMLEFCF